MLSANEKRLGIGAIVVFVILLLVTAEHNNLKLDSVDAWKKHAIFCDECSEYFWYGNYNSICDYIANERALD